MNTTKTKTLAIICGLAAFLALPATIQAGPPAQAPALGLKNDKKDDHADKAKEMGKGKGQAIKNDAELAKLREEFRKAREEHLTVVQKLRDEYKTATEERKAKLREELAKLRTEWATTQKEHAQDVKDRAKEIRNEFKNREHDRVVDAAKDTKDSTKGKGR